MRRQASRSSRSQTASGRVHSMHTAQSQRHLLCDVCYTPRTSAGFVKAATPPRRPASHTLCVTKKAKKGANPAPDSWQSDV
jgi:hypothetical protein